MQADAKSRTDGRWLLSFLKALEHTGAVFPLYRYVRFEVRALVSNNEDLNSPKQRESNNHSRKESKVAYIRYHFNTNTTLKQ